ncbi:MAG: GTP-dependent dephospho-CoA kinase family protein [Thermoplasmatota archaeon]
MVATAPVADLRPPRRYVLPEGLRRELGAAFGPIVQSSELVAALEGADIVLAVGDVVSLTLKTLGVTPRLFVCDYQTQRGLGSGVHRDAANEKTLYELELGNWGELAFRVRNPPTTITREAWDAIRLGLQHDEGPVRVVVEGEEDLLGIPCFLEAPNGSVVLYGMPNQGVVVVRVDAAFKKRVADLLGKFTRE